MVTVGSATKTHRIPWLDSFCVKKKKKEKKLHSLRRVKESVTIFTVFYLLFHQLSICWWNQYLSSIFTCKQEEQHLGCEQIQSSKEQLSLVVSNLQVQASIEIFPPRNLHLNHFRLVAWFDCAGLHPLPLDGIPLLWFGQSRKEQVTE